MGRVNLNDLDKYSSGGSGKVRWFRLADDKDKAQVRIMLEDPDDLNNFIFSTHKVKMNPKAKFDDTHVNCLRAYNDPVEDCPFCSDERSLSVRVFLPVYNIDADEVQFFDRPRSIIGKIQGLMNRYKDFPSHIFEIERNGEKGDKGTTYEFYEIDDDDTTLEDLPEIPDVLGGAVLDKSFDDMEYFIQEGEFPPEDDEDEKPVRRKKDSTKSRRRDEEDDEGLPFEEDDEEEEVRPRRERNREDRGRRVSANRNSSRRRRTNEDEF